MRRHSRAPRPGFAIALVAIVTAIVAAGCQWAYPMARFGSEDAMPSPRATYSRRTASIAVDGEADQPIALTRISKGPHVFSVIGTTVTWRGDDGWVLRVSAYDDPGFGSVQPYADVEIHRIADGEHLVTVDPPGAR